MACPSPFLALKNYPASGGDTDARFCAPLPTVEGLPFCCLPCPKQKYVYPDNFETLIHASTYLNVVGVVSCAFLLLSFAVLPVEYTHRHYLSVCLTLAILLMQSSFVIPMGNPTSQCYDAITPHDMYSSVNCALSGAFLLGGGWSTVMWVFLRTLSLHLQICWQVVPGRRFFLSAQAAGWSIPVVFLAVALSVTGVAFRFGESCHINSKHSVATFWGPLLAVAAASIVTQSITFGYCIQVYLRSLLEEKQATEPHSPLPYATSIRTVTAAQALRRIQRVVALQWRGISVVVIIIADVVFFATVFLQFDNTTERTPENIRRAMEWASCVIENEGDKNRCLDVASKLVVPEAKAMAVLFLLSCNGIWALVLLGRFTIVTGWIKFFQNIFKRNNSSDEFVSYHAQRISEPDGSSYEMLDSRKRITTSTTASTIRSIMIKAPEPLSSSAPREYNPSTFSAQLRGSSETDVYPSSRLRSGPKLTSPPFSPYRDLDSANRSPPLTGGGGSFSPYRDTRGETDTPEHLSVHSASKTPTPTYPPEAKIGIGIAN